MRELPFIIWPLTASLALHVGAIALLGTALGAPQGATQSETANKSLHVTLALSERTAALAVAASGEPSSPPHELIPEGSLALPGSYYFPPQELSRKPQPAGPVPLNYPAESPLVPRGSIVLRLLINEAGNVDHVIVEKSELPKELEEVAKLAFSQARFQPGIRENRPANSQLMIEVTFEGDEAPENKPPPGK